MSRAIPLSLAIFVATGAPWLLQFLGDLGIVFMVILVPIWSPVVINAGMVGISMEALVGRVYRVWLLVPLIFYGGYYGFAINDHFTLTALREAYDEANSKVDLPFDPERQALVLENEPPSWFVANYALTVAYSASANDPESFRSSRLIEDSVCDEVREMRSLVTEGIQVSGFYDGEDIGSRALETRFCSLSMPETPDLPRVRVRREESEVVESRLPVRRVITTIETPDGRTYDLKGGTASPLLWLPMPIALCTLDDDEGWACDWGFWRNSPKPIVSGTTQYSRDLLVLARALGLKPVAQSERRGAQPPKELLLRIEQAKQERLQAQLANVEAMIADPLMESPDWDTRFLAEHPDTVAQRSTAIMAGVEKAAAIGGPDRTKAGESGRILAGLLAALPDADFRRLKLRILAVYEGADDRHWLWEVESLLGRLGDLGVEAMPYLAKARTLPSQMGGAWIEGMCRVGFAGRDAASPHLKSAWNSVRDVAQNERREALYVAMRRVGIDPPPLAEDRRNQLSELRLRWADISPRSQASVCATRVEAAKRRQQEVMALRAGR